MGRKVIAFWLSLTMVLSLIVVLDVIIDFTPSVEGGIIRYVNETGSGGAFTKIQDAINASNDGDTVFVYNGTYYENVVANKTINLTGEDKNYTIINGGSNGPVIFLSVNWVNVSGFSVTGNGVLGDAGIKLIDNENCSIFDNKVFNNKYGIYLWNSHITNISNNHIINNRELGIWLRESNLNNLELNNASYNTYYGIRILNSDENIISNNHILDNQKGIHLDYADGNIIVNNNATDNEFGIYLYKAVGNNFSANIMIRNGIFIERGFLEHWNTHNMDSLNTVNGKPVYYLKNQTGGSVPQNAGQIILANCTKVKIAHQELKNGSVGILLGFSQENNITSSNISFNSKYGIYFYSSSNNHIMTNNISFNAHGVYIYQSPFNNIRNNNVSLNSESGISIYLSDNNITSNNIYSNDNYGILIMSDKSNIIGNNIYSNNDIGIYLEQARNINIIDNNVSSNTNYGIAISFSWYDNIINNTFSNNGVFIVGDQLFHYNTHIILDDNLVNEKPLYYFKNNNNISIDNISVGQLILANCSNILISNINITNTDVGIELAYTINVTINFSNIFSNRRYGIYSFFSKYNHLTNTNISHNYDGIYFDKFSDNNVISDNTISFNNRDGFYLSVSDVNVIIANNISYNNRYGILSWGSTKNIIYHNNFVNNTNQVFDSINDYNQWNDSYPLGGNYWSDYSGIDNFKGPNQDIPGSDGIGDSPYVIDADSQDNYPLMKPYTPKPLENYTILKQGWNLISAPLIQDNEDLSKVLEMIDGYYDAVQWYDIIDTGYPWKHHKVGKPFGNDLFKLNESMGFWIHITQPGDTIFLYNGTQPLVNQTITLHPGWNMVGYPSLASYNRTEGLNNLTFNDQVDAIWSYDASIQKWQEMGESDHFQIGKGYYIHAKSECEWEVPL